MDYLNKMHILWLHQGKTKSMVHLAAVHGNIDIAKLLLNHGAQIDCLDEDGYTAMHYAALGNNVHMIHFLHTQVMISDFMI